MKKPAKQDSVIVKEYVRRLSDEDLTAIIERLTEPVCGDRADVSRFFEKDKELDRWLCLSKGWEEWFDKVDFIEENAIMELARRQKSKDKKDKK